MHVTRSSLYFTLWEGKVWANYPAPYSMICFMHNSVWIKKIKNEGNEAEELAATLGSNEVDTLKYEYIWYI